MKLFHGLDETLIDYSSQDVNFADTYNLQRTTIYLYTYKTLITLIVCLFGCLFVCLRPCVRILDTEWLL